jgi:hypothetical protein
MGGRGSGGHNSKGKLRDVQCARLDVHELGREGRLELGTRGRLFGTLRFEVAGGPDAQRLVLESPRTPTSGEPLDPIRQVIGCYWRKAHFGGRYLIFRCSECHRSARVLYAWYGSHHHEIWFFRCGSCAGITSVHYGPPVGPLGASCREIARSAQLAGGCRAGQAARHAREDVPAHFGATSLSRGGTKAGRELRSKIHARSALCPSVAAMPKQVCGAWRLATSLIGRARGRRTKKRSAQACSLHAMN